MAKPAVINPEINYSASSTACKTDKTMSSDSSRTSCHQVNPYVEPGSCPTSLDIVREGTLIVYTWVITGLLGKRMGQGKESWSEASTSATEGLGSSRESVAL